jgi:hypothetical protein
MSDEKKLLTRRTFLKTAGAAAAGAAAAACAQPAPAPAPTKAPEPTAAPEPTPVPEPTVKGGPLEVGVFQEEGPWFDITKDHVHVRQYCERPSALTALGGRRSA